MVVGMFKSMGLSLPGAWSATGAIYGSLAMITLLITTLTIKENPALAGEPSIHFHRSKAFSPVSRTEPFVLLMIVFLLGIFCFHRPGGSASISSSSTNWEWQDQTSIIMIASLLTTGCFLFPAKLTR